MLFVTVEEFSPSSHFIHFPLKNGNFSPRVRNKHLGIKQQKFYHLINVTGTFAKCFGQSRLVFCFEWETCQWGKMSKRRNGKSPHGHWGSVALWACFSSKDSENLAGIHPIIKSQEILKKIRWENWKRVFTGTFSRIEINRNCSQETNSIFSMDILI